MIINNRYNFLFVHIQKTAGTSISDFLFKINGTERFGNHHSFIKDNEIKNLDKYFKFCFVRNPWDRLVSWYTMMIKKSTHNDFSKYLLKNSTNFSEFLNLTDIIYELDSPEYNPNKPYPKSISFNQLDYISDNEGNIAVDFIGRFENINDDFEIIKNKIGITNTKLKHLNKFEHRDYREYYSDNDIEKVYKMYERDINYFNYEF